MLKGRLIVMGIRYKGRDLFHRLLEGERFYTGERIKEGDEIAVYDDGKIYRKRKGNKIKRREHGREKN